MDIFGALADPVRRSLLVELSEESRRVVDLAATRSISRPAVSKHLRVLLQSGVVTVTDHGRERYYDLDPSALEPVAAYLARLAPASAAPVAERALDALELEVRRTGRDRRAADQEQADQEQADQEQEETA